MSLRPSPLNKLALLPVVFLAVSLISSCGSSSTSGASALPERVVASQGVAAPPAVPGLVVVNGQYDVLAGGRISAGISPGLMTTSPDRSVLLAFDSIGLNVEVINTVSASQSGSIPVPGETISMVAPNSLNAYVAVPSAPLTEAGVPPGAVLALNLQANVITATISVPNAQMLVASPDGSQILVFSNDNTAGIVTILSPLLIDTGTSPTTTVSGFDRPMYAIFSADGSTAYILNCGPECSSSAGASVQTLNMSTLAVGAPVAVDGATIGWLSGTTLYVAGTPTASASNPAPNNSCAGQNTAATICGRIDTIDTSTMTVTGSAVITDGYHDRIAMSVNGQLFIGSYACTNIGNVNDPQGEVRGCLSILNTTNGEVIIPPDNGDVTGLQSFTSRYVVYVAEGGNLRVYDTQTDSLLVNQFIASGTITIPGQVIDVQAIDFF